MCVRVCVRVSMIVCKYVYALEISLRNVRKIQQNGAAGRVCY